MSPASRFSRQPIRLGAESRHARIAAISSRTVAAFSNSRFRASRNISASSLRICCIACSGVSCDRLAAPAFAARHHARAFHDVLDGLDDGFRRDAVLLVVLDLLRAPSVHLGDRALHRAGHPVGIEDRRARSLRAARPMVWISEPFDRRKPSLSASRIATSDTSGRSRPSRSRLMPTSTSNFAEPQVADDLDALDRLDVGVQVAHLDAVFVEVFGQVLGHALGQRRDQHALVPRDAQADLRQQVVHLRRDRPHLDHRDRRARSAARPARPPARTSRARTAPASPRRRSSAARRAPTRRNAAAGCRAPTAGGNRTRPASPCASDRPVHAPICGIVTWLSSTTSSAVPRQVVEQAGRRLARLAARQVARVVLDAGAVAELRDHLEIEERALLEPLRFDELVRGRAVPRAAPRSSTLISSTAASSRSRGVT